MMGSIESSRALLEFFGHAAPLMAVIWALKAIELEPGLWA
jgi:hypothetical protein